MLRFKRNIFVNRFSGPGNSKINITQTMNKLISFFMMPGLLIVSVDMNSSPFYLHAELKANESSFKTVSIFDNDSTSTLVENKYKAAVDRLKLQAASIQAYAKANHFNTEYCFLADMSIPSGKNRLFVYNIKKDAVEYASLVAHGMGSETADNDQLVFSNIPNSRQTSLGKYKIGKSYYGTFGLAYKLYGLDNTNSKAFERAIVLHSLDEVPDAETYPQPISRSAGCPMVSPSSLAMLDKYIRSSQKPILLWIYN